MSRQVLAVFGFLLVSASITKIHASATYGSVESTGVGSNYDWGCADFDPSTSTSLIDYLWCSSTDLAEAAYNTGFIQGIKSGRLRTIDYAKFEIQDCTWLNHGANLYGTLCDNKSCTEQVATFFKIESEGYAAAALNYTLEYVMRIDSAIPVAENIAYMDFEKNATTTYDSEYAVVVMTPCLQLWPMLAERLESEGAKNPTNLYSSWIELNLSLFEDVARARAVLDDPVNVYDWDLALRLYREASQLEVDFFAWATTATT